MNRILLIALTFAACTPKGVDSAEPEVFDFSGNTFTMTSIGVDDQCADGSFTTLLLPEGDGSTNEWEYPIEIPSWTDMASGVTYEIQLQEPFNAMEVTVTQGDAEGIAVMTGAQQNDVLLNEDLHGDCTVDMTIDATIVLNSDTDVSGSAALSIDDPQGELCPQLVEGCSVLLDFTGSAE